MALFQSSVLKKHLNLLDKSLVIRAYKKYAKYFLNSIVQENIRNSNEEQFQATFLTELFVNVLDYSINPNPQFNLTTEFKNQKNNRKADGAILRKDMAIGVIELKGTNTRDLESIRRQAFDYKANQKGCVYVITSNFEKLRFYINDATEFIEFDLFQLSEPDFELLFLCLYKDHILNNLPLQIKEDSLVVEEQITKEFYKDYSLFKRELFRDLVKRNAKRIRLARQEQLKEITSDEAYTHELQSLDKNVKLALFKKSQKLIDRFLFIFFSEDRGLLPPNSTLQILNKWKADMDFGDERPIYNLFKQYFHYLDTGRKGTTSRPEIYAYNGGLFQPDTILDELEIDDDLLYTHTLKLAKYDFESQVDVNILGHIFENSLNEIESVNAEIEGAVFDKQKSKRKKDGVYYTPKYITKYIVENTVGKLCEEKKAELGFKEEEYFKSRTYRLKKKLGELVKLLDDYREWLLQLTICDPACGSGAFLNQALDFLIKEHRYIDELKAKVLGGGLVFADIENTILENNIYGVDLNEESVEIAKLSLWLRTAQPRRKLNDLSNNIKCGNSLIDDKKVAGNKAFNWQYKFPKIFQKGGFDVVIGNPPYVRSRELFSELEKQYYLKNYETTSYQLDLYKLFIEKSSSLINAKGLLSFITPSVFLTNDYDNPIRQFILDKHYLEKVVTSEKDIFEDASVKTVVFVVSKRIDKGNVEFLKIKDNEFFTEKKIPQKAFIDQGYLINENIDAYAIPIITKMNNFSKLGAHFEIKNGIKVRKDLLFKIKRDNNHKPFILGKNVHSFFFSFDGVYIDYKNENEKLFTNQAFRTPDIFEREKLIVRQILGERIQTCLDTTNIYTDQTTYVINQINKSDTLRYLLCILNSKLLYYFFKNTFSDNKKTFPKVKRSQLLELPFVENKHTEEFEKKAIKISRKVLENKDLISKFLKFLKEKLGIHKFSNKLLNWNTLDFGDFIKELNKATKTNNKIIVAEGKEPMEALTKKDEFEWLELFEENKKKAQELQVQIDSLEHHIDMMVYELYGLNEEEIIIVENS